jgi:hypothetical protein
LIDSLNKLLDMMQALGAVRFYAKRLAANDNSKNQIYLGGGFGALNILPHAPVTSDETVIAGSVRRRDKADMRFFWVDETGPSPAPDAQLILYPKYPEVRMSGFLRGAEHAPADLMRSRGLGRVLFLGICGDGRILGYAAGSDHPVVAGLDNAGFVEQAGVFLDLTPLRAGIGNSREALIAALTAIHNKGWIPSQKIGRSGFPEPYSALNGGGYTLEAELGISPNGYSEPDFLGWEVKQYGVSDFTNYRPKSPVTLMTPEPTGGIYRDGVEGFLREFGYADKNGREDRINFGGIYRVGGDFHADTGLALQITGFDAAECKINDLDGALVLLDVRDRIAASWGLRGLIDHWNRKHAKAVYVPSLSRKLPPQYQYGSIIQLCEETDFLLFLTAVSRGAVYYDPAIKMESASTARPAVKRRSQFRVAHPVVGKLYRRDATIALNLPLEAQ